MKSANHFLPQSTVCHRVDLCSEANSSCCHTSDTCQQLEWKVLSAEIAILQIGSSERSLIYSRKSVGPKIRPFGTPALPRYSCEDFLSRTSQSHLLLRKGEIRPKSDLKFHKSYGCEGLGLGRRPA